MLDNGIGRLQQRCIAQRRDRIGCSPGPKQLSGQRKQVRHLLRRGWVGRMGHDMNLGFVKYGRGNRKCGFHRSTLEGEPQPELNRTRCSRSHRTHRSSTVYRLDDAAESRSGDVRLRQSILRVVKDIEKVRAEL